MARRCHWSYHITELDLSYWSVETERRGQKVMLLLKLLVKPMSPPSGTLMPPWHNHLQVREEYMHGSP